MELFFRESLQQLSHCHSNWDTKDFRVYIWFLLTQLMPRNINLVRERAKF